MVVGELRKGHWNWKSAELKMPESVVGTTRNGIDFEIHVTDTFGARMKWRAQAVFERATVVTSEMMARINSIVQQWFALLRNTSEDIDLMLATKNLMRDLKKIDPSLSHVDMRLTSEAGEVIVVHNEPAVEDFVAAE